MKILLKNKRALFDYQVEKKITAGIVLLGKEVKSLRMKSGSLNGSFVKIINNEAVLINAQISLYKFSDNREYDPKRTRKLLLRKKEIYKFGFDLDKKGYTLVPLSIYLEKNLIKLKIGLAKGKKTYQKKALLKKRDLERELAKQMKNI
jgi:SsrA-binding protein